MKIEIRKAKKNECEKISHLIQETIKKINSEDHTKKQLSTYIEHYSKDQIIKRMKTDLIFCAFEQDKLVGTIFSRKNKITGLYVKYNHLKKGIGKKLLLHLEKICKKKGIRKLWLTSTKKGYRFYTKNGFIQKGKIIVSWKGVKFRETKMEKMLK